ncbi:MAG: flavin-containing monooxygenase, partial [Myxococcota bacterium]
MPSTERICIIGAGPVGLAVAKALGESGVAYTHLEATDHVGGNWAHGVYETAHIISSRKTTEYPDWPMPAHWPNFPSAQQMKAYYEDFAAAHSLGQHIRFTARVTAVRPDGSGWSVECEGAEPEHYRGVVVCNGHHWDRVLPEWASDFSGTVLHSKDYKRPDQLRGQRVLVVGGGNSGCDLVSEAARVASGADWSLRRGYHFLPKTLLGVPTVELMTPWMPVAVQRIVLSLAVRLTL